MVQPSKADRKSTASYYEFALEQVQTVQAWYENEDTEDWEITFDLARLCRSRADSEKYKLPELATWLYLKSDFLREQFPSEEDFATEFMLKWTKIRTLDGADWLTTAAARSLTESWGIREEHRTTTTKGYARFINLCIQLCLIAGTNKIKLPCREVGSALGVRPNTVSSYRQLAVEHGYLILLKEHVHVPNGRGEATKFRFRSELWDKLEKELKSKRPVLGSE